MEKSDLKYPLIHGQGRQVSELATPRILLNRPVEVELLCPSWGPWLRGPRGCFKVTGMFLSQPRGPMGHSPPLCAF